jgi:hypothetical protein
MYIPVHFSIRNETLDLDLACTHRTRVGVDYTIDIAETEYKNNPAEQDRQVFCTRIEQQLF